MLYIDYRNSRLVVLSNSDAAAKEVLIQRHKVETFLPT